jgi:hypothetical protein
MTLAGVRKGDIVRVAGSLAYVTDKDRGRLQIRWAGSDSLRWVRAIEVEAHWRRTRS